MSGVNRQSLKNVKCKSVNVEEEQSSNAEQE